ncbi:MAG: GatB/YqeY domain-containing protein [Thermodesulfobacteriota bacterium]|jgi:uncharacterized protein YqeY
MSLRDQIPEDLKTALRGKKSLDLSVLRMLQAAIKNREIDNKGELNDEEIVQVVSSEIKKRRDAIEEFTKVSREDAAEAEQLEINVLMKYMPEQLSEEEVASKVQELVAGSGAAGLKDLGIAMKVVMPALKGKADGKLINKYVREQLAKLEQG